LANALITCNDSIEMNLVEKELPSIMELASATTLSEKTYRVVRKGVWLQIHITRQVLCFHLVQQLICSGSCTTVSTEETTNEE
jgi:hypothetical protein